MNHLRLGIAALAAIILIAGSGYIVWNGMSANNQTTPANPEGTYTIADVASHNTQQNCWTTINGNVYDLTSWVSRHPGGENPILFLCGIDGSEAFNTQHGVSRTAMAVLGLLKIGVLK